MNATLSVRYDWKGKERLFTVSTVCESTEISKVFCSFQRYLSSWIESDSPRFISLELAANFKENDGQETGT